MSHPRCPKCWSGNIIGYMGEWECMDCGYKFKIPLERPAISRPPTPAPEKPTPMRPSPPKRVAYSPPTTEPGEGRGKWIGAIIVALIIGLIVGYGAGYMMSPGQAIINTTYTTITIPTTVTIAQPASPSTITRYVTEATSITVTATETVTITAIPSPPSGCEILSGEVTLRHNTPHLYVKFKTSVAAAIKLIGPDGEEKSANIVTSDETAVYLQMSPYGETPKAGKYKVVMDSLLGKLAEKEFEFKGYEVNGIRMEFEKTWHEFIGGSLTKITVYLKNTGDLPTYAVKAKITIGRESKVVDIFSKPIPPGDSSFDIPIYVSLLSAGSHPVKVTLVNDEGKEIATIEGALIFP